MLRQWRCDKYLSTAGLPTQQVRQSESRVQKPKDISQFSDVMQVLLHPDDDVYIVEPCEHVGEGVRASDHLAEIFMRITGTPTVRWKLYDIGTIMDNNNFA